jgi:Leucine carboxyl methyltransferase
MGKPLIENVSDTAFMVAVYRAIETARPDALFHDFLADRLAGDHGRRIVASLRSSLLGPWSVVVRTCIIDDFYVAALAQGMDTILNLGAGLDTRPYRMTVPGSDISLPACTHVLRKIEGREPRLGAISTAAPGVVTVATVMRQCGAMPLAVSSLIAFAFFDKCANPIPRSTFAALVN